VDSDIGLWITAIVGFVTGISGVIMAFRKERREDKHSDADVAKLYQEIASQQASKNRELESCQDMLEEKVDKLEHEVNMLRVEKEVEIQYSNALVRYIQYLVTLMEQAGIKPVRDMPERKHQTT